MYIWIHYCCSEWEGLDPVNQFNHTRLVAFVTVCPLDYTAVVVSGSILTPLKYSADMSFSEGVNVRNGYINDNSRQHAFLQKI